MQLEAIDAPAGLVLIVGDRMAALAQAGEDGWELVAATTSDNRYRATLFFKRPKDES